MDILRDLREPRFWAVTAICLVMQETSMLPMIVLLQSPWECRIACHPYMRSGSRATAGPPRLANEHKHAAAAILDKQAFYLDVEPSQGATRSFALVRFTCRVRRSGARWNSAG